MQNIAKLCHRGQLRKTRRLYNVFFERDLHVFLVIKDVFCGMRLQKLVFKMLQQAFIGVRCFYITF